MQRDVAAEFTRGDLIAGPGLVGKSDHPYLVPEEVAARFKQELQKAMQDRAEQEVQARRAEPR